MLLGPTGLSVSSRGLRRRSGRTWLPQPVALLGTAPPTGFSQAFIQSVNPPVQHGTELLLSWAGNAPAGTVYQVYLDGKLVWAGTGTRANIPLPTVAGRIEIGTVSNANRILDRSSDLPAAPQRSASLAWLGGTFEGGDIAGFHVYGATQAAGAVDYSTILATVPAYSGTPTDGFGYGGFGYGGFGAAAGSYSWKSKPLAGGSWAFAVKPFDTAGNEGTAATASVSIPAPPLPPAPFSANVRLRYSYNATSHAVTLNWNPSP